MMSKYESLEIAIQRNSKGWSKPWTVKYNNKDSGERKLKTKTVDWKWCRKKIKTQETSELRKQCKNYKM
jgi:hypothetical protein